MENVVFEHMQSRIGHTMHRLETIDNYKNHFVLTMTRDGQTGMELNLKQTVSSIGD